MLGISKITFQYLLRLYAVFLILVVIFSSLFFQFFGLVNTLGFLLGALTITIATVGISFLVITNTENLHEKLQTNHYLFSINSIYLSVVSVAIGALSFLGGGYLFLQYINQISVLPFIICGVVLFFLITNLVVSRYLWFIKTSKPYLYLIDQKKLKKDAEQSFISSRALVSNLELINSLTKLTLVLIIFGVFIYLTKTLSWILIGATLLVFVFNISFQILNYYLSQIKLIDFYQLISRKNTKDIISNFKKREDIAKSFHLTDLIVNIFTLIILATILYQKQIFELSIETSFEFLLTLLLVLILTLGVLKTFSKLYLSLNQSSLKKFVISFKRKNIKELLIKKPFFFFSFIYENSFSMMLGLIVLNLFFSLILFLSINYLGLKVVSLFIPLACFLLASKLIYQSDIFGTLKNIEKKNNIIYENLSEGNKLTSFLHQTAYENFWVFAIVSLAVGAFLNSPH